MGPDSDTQGFGDGQTDFPEELRILIGIMILSNAIDEKVGTQADSDGVTKSERKLLIHLGSPCRMGQLAEDLRTLPSSVTLIADQLEKRGLIVRERDPNDRRAWQLRLTEAGDATRKEIIEMTISMFRQLVGIETEDISALASLMDKVTQNILNNGISKGLKL